MARDRVRARNKVLFLVSPFVPYPPARGIELRIVRLLRWLRREGYGVVLVVPAEEIGDVALAELRKDALEVYWTRPAWRTRLGRRFPRLRNAIWKPLKWALGNASSQYKGSSGSAESVASRHSSDISAAQKSSHLGDDSVKSWFAPAKLVRLVGKLSRQLRPEAVIVEYIFSSPVFAEVPRGTLRIIDTIDVFSRKEDQVLAYGIADPLACSESEERAYLMQADVLIAIQSREAQLLKALAPEREVLLAGIDLDVVFSTNDDSLPNSIAVVASDNPLNVHGLTEFLSECWPTIKEAWPAVSLHVVGKVGNMCRVEDSAIRYSGWIDDLDQIYREASIVINPTIAGTGLKIKSVQALAHGKPLVAWSNGVEGLDYEGTPPYKLCHSWTEFADAVVLLLKSDEERLKMSQRAYTYATEKFGADTVYAALKSRLELDDSPATRMNSKHDDEVRRAVATR
jgi:glycosyltransferase involved in cell wall biosynthesis